MFGMLQSSDDVLPENIRKECDFALATAEVGNNLVSFPIVCIKTEHRKFILLSSHRLMLMVSLAFIRK